MVVYERAPKNYGTILTFALSALWHGFYPGYYLTFATGALFVAAARKVFFTSLMFVFNFTILPFVLLGSTHVPPSFPTH